jgi:hypothetical protein
MNAATKFFYFKLNKYITPEKSEFLRYFSKALIEKLGLGYENE